MKIRNNSILILGLICLVLEVVRDYYYTDSTLDAASYFCLSTFVFLVSDVFARLAEEQRDIDVPLTKDIEGNVLDDIFFILLFYLASTPHAF